ncbi:putative ABC transporter permease [Dinoroseobacter shibae DFL 12 = DSM 16493]|uniref:Putative ABC transporter permease n=1 Tax=Dinoroseobacter shibae (strain DSM 16493 / NCIMB 14021 / DFL 12) TaxID=398580 RepID=A8LIH1_DINSH|nr:FtsX-like permease family protein [Dinoroseobacter shibae]ABV94412.1 putative ABC transporter permease [Dinoroseobacter shibae DFL 12 = DSM 16493]URF45839.1 FtsX-like permease family protein [Dinoroseobacter shibae]URF50146.1 FtsX-like permease family protein [Dinoroseobacter shibae]
MNLAVAGRIARRELRGGVRGFRVFLLCLVLGVAAIAAVGSVRVAIQQGLEREGAVILGGDGQMEFTYRFAEPDELAWMEENALEVSEIVEFRSMVVVDGPEGPERGLTQVKAVDDLYPLKGAVVLEPAIPLAEALGGEIPGAVMQRVLIDRMGLEIGDTFRLGTQEFRLTAALEREPDSAGGGFGLGPTTILRTEALAESGLIGPGTLYETEYRLALPEDADLQALEEEAEALFRDTGMRWRDSRNAAPGVERFVERIGSFLVLVGLAGLAVGGVGISAAVRAYLDGKTQVIATLKTLGAEGGTIFAAYLMQIGILTAIGVGLGLVLGAAIPIVAAPLLTANLPMPAAFGLHPGPLAEAALYGVLTALVFTLWPLARTEQVRAAELFRDAAAPKFHLPSRRYMVALGLAVAALIGSAVAFSGIPTLALGSLGGIAGALLLLVGAAWLVRRAARRLARSRMVRGRTALRLALGAVGGPGGETTSVVLSLGLGLAVLAAVGQIDSNLRNVIAEELPNDAPSYFFVDIQPDQIGDFLSRTRGDPAVRRVDSAPMLRGVITRINGEPAREVAGDHWVLRGDRGVTYATAPGPDTRIVEGAFWPEDYDGPPQISFAEEEARELGLELGDRLTVNILGRDIEGEITSFRVVDFSTAGIGFVLTMNPAALRGAPHTFISTVYAEEAAEAQLLRDVAADAPNITAIRVRDAIDRVTEALSGLAAATSYGAAATLVTGFVVLIGAAAAGERARVFEAAVLKTVGATRGRILASFALRSAMLGLAAGLVAIFAGGLAGWGVMTFVMEAGYRFEPVSALAIVTGGALATLLAGLAFAWRPLATRPARTLRARE